MTSLPNLDQLNPEQLRALAAQLMQHVESLEQKVETIGKKIHRDQTVIKKLTHEIAQLKRFMFAKRSEQLSPDQASLLDDLIDTDIAAIEAELEALKLAPASTEVRQKPKRIALPPQFPRTLIHQEPDNSHCQCGWALKRIGEDVSEKLDYTPGCSPLSGTSVASGSTTARPASFISKPSKMYGASLTVEGMACEANGANWSTCNS